MKKRSKIAYMVCLPLCCLLFIIVPFTPHKALQLLLACVVTYLTVLFIYHEL